MKRLVLLSSVSSDAHTWNLVYLQLLIEELGHDVVNLGACVPDGLLVESALRHGPDLVVLSTVNGHGYGDGKRVITALRAQQALRNTPVVIGGKLGVAGPLEPERVDELRAAGFDAVFGADAGAEELRRFIGDLVPTSAGGELVT
ncbi:cobalamin B12-binding domain-containing protein [Actinokineospora sp. UTMC 2448]|uniref:cobalamin B12-binding domain-containing protein n=1 Tax=Actinokineospora sp. UTMC 2448 TaxID=2268449 RepID=UPI0021649F8E|nr:cobalamin-dependent protein [Actinokineospora sp. UTMC 2448]UVS80626.1 methylaspartate mutase subunit S [Actinokineospora sp. UTMC 2448]